MCSDYWISSGLIHRLLISQPQSRVSTMIRKLAKENDPDPRQSSLQEHCVSQADAVYEVVRPFPKHPHMLSIPEIRPLIE